MSHDIWAFPQLCRISYPFHDDDKERINQRPFAQRRQDGKHFHFYLDRTSYIPEHWASNGCLEFSGASGDFANIWTNLRNLYILFLQDADRLSLHRFDTPPPRSTQQRVPAPEVPISVFPSRTRVRPPKLSMAGSWNAPSSSSRTYRSTRRPSP